MAYKLLLEKPEGKCSCGRLKITWEDNIIRDLKETDYEGNWKTLAHHRVMWCAYVLAAKKPLGFVMPMSWLLSYRKLCLITY